MSAEIERVAWPLAQIPEAMEAVARAAGLSFQPVALPAPPAGLDEGGPSLMEWIGLAASALGLEAEPLGSPYEGVESMLRGAGPALVVLPGAPPRVVAIAGPGRRRLPVFGGDRRVHRVRVDALRAHLCGPLEQRVLPAVEAMLERAEVPPARRPRALRAMLRERIGTAQVRGVLLLRSAPGASLFAQARRLGIPRRVLVLFAANTALQALLVAVFWAVGRAALEDRIDSGWVAACALLLVSSVPMRVLVLVTGMRVALDAGALLKQRLLAGALGVETSEMRAMGAGQLLGRVIESEAIESLVLGSGLQGLAAAVELAMAVGILAASAAGPLPMIALFAWLALAAGLLARYFLRRRAWTRVRLEMTHDLIERLVGHRTRLAQEPAERFHEGEDRLLSRYLRSSQALDGAEVWATAFVRRGFIVVGAASLAPALLAGAPPAAIAIAIGGLLMGLRGLQTLLGSAAQLTGAAVVWEQIAPLYRAATDGEAVRPALLAAVGDTSCEGAVIDARQIVVRRPGRAEPVLAGVSLRIEEGDRLLLEGPSGAGKSTLGAVLAGLLSPASGLVLVRGLDFRTLGRAGFRRKVASAPQFQENHVLTGPFAFNLLMGRAWPPSPRDLEEAEAICRELGLGGLLDRMPSGMMQMVGETGWQLSHGEKSRLYIARALLQRAELVVLDESFAALDPETLSQCLRCVLDRARSLLVIAHP